jgi:hypothetical protein
MKYPTPKTTIECTVSGCGFFDEIELERSSTRIIAYHYESWRMPEDWDEGWTVNEDSGAVCPNHEDEPEATLSAAERNRGLTWRRL